jgi:hypothetical protein
MMNICYQCGLYRADKIIDPAGPYAICPECGFKHPFKQLPLFVVGGASSTGKTTVLKQLIGKMDEFVLLETDVLWRDELKGNKALHREFFETWLRLSKDISQSGRPVMLFGGGCSVPENLEACVERRYFARIHYMAFVVDDMEIERRLLRRPAWRNASTPEFIQAQIEFNRWFKQSKLKPELEIELLDTTTLPVEKAGAAVARWARERNTGR